MSIAQRFGSNLNRCRKAAGLSQEEAAVRASLHRTHISLLENGKRMARIDTVVKLAAVLDVDPAELLDGIAWKPGSVKRGRFESD